MQPVPRGVVSSHEPDASSCDDAGPDADTQGQDKGDRACNPHPCMALEAREATLKSRIEEQDKMLAEAADYLNAYSSMIGMDIGAKITAYRLAQERASL